MKTIYTSRNERDLWGLLVLASKYVVWLGVLAAYSVMLMSNHKDWFSQPGVFQGNIQEIEQKVNSQTYTLTVSDGSQQKFFHINTMISSLQIGEKVKLVYLPQLKDVISCEVLPNS